MKQTNEVTALVFDHGLGVPIAERLARDFKRVLYFSDWEEGFSVIKRGVIGHGIPTIERCHDIWDVVEEIDLFVFPDIQHSGLQTYLESIGKPVWGSKRADRLETNREFFLEKLEEWGFPVPTHKVIEGTTRLRRYLYDKEDKYIKISRWRGDLETTHWRSFRLDANIIDHWALRFGAVRDLVRFLVFDNIDTPLEIGADTYNIHGKWPDLMLHGIEKKDMAYLAAVTSYEEMPEVIRDILPAVGEYLREERYANEWSMEVRVTEDSFYFTDPTTRLGLPSTGSQLEIWGNLSEIIWHGAHGEMVQPEPTAKFSGELILCAKSCGDVWPCVEIPEPLKQWLKLADCCEVDGLRYFPRESGEDEHVGWLVAIGDTPQQVVERLKSYVAELPKGLSADISPLADVIKEIETEEKDGIDFTAKKMPQASEVIE